MREILFRGKSIVADSPNTPAWWIEGNLFHQTNDGVNCYHILDGTKTIDGLDVDTEVWPETVGQFTGLTDKFGKKIFDGDIIYQERTYTVRRESGVLDTTTNRRWAVIFITNYGVEYSYVENYRKNPGEYWLVNDYECGIEEDRWVVVGNIHDNPELIGGGENADY